MSCRRNAVPWVDWVEWQDVHESLFSTDPFLQQRAVSRVAAWRSRTQLPVAINATSQLVELQLHESMAQHHHHAVGVSSRSHSELSLLYANIIVRCVNGLVDASQKGEYAHAVSTLAQRIGIPLWIVDLRHESTHNQLPSLPVLRFAARHLLAWLRANYWNAQERLIRGRVHHVAEKLFLQFPHLGNQLRDDKSSIQEAHKLEFDVDTLRNVVIPLLVCGEQYGERVALTGLMFLRVFDVMGNSEKEAFVSMLLQLQSMWRRFSASLLAALCQKVFDVICSPESRCQKESKADQARKIEREEFHEQNEIDMTILWIQFMVSGEYRERMKLQIDPIEDLCQCGAEMLALGESIKVKVTKGFSTDLLKRLVTTLRSSKSIRNHSTLAIDSANSTESLSNQKLGWVQLAWVESPLGLRYSYASHQSICQRQLCEYSLDNDILMPESTSFVNQEEEEDDSHTIDNDDAEMVMDALMEDWDATYNTTLQQTLDLQDTIARDGLRQGDSTTVLPKQELLRIQEEIEIW
ncbi:hypothetical protein Plhal304r1_c020g0072981 [Plasmopara halstedii]